jgi:hypothetical protein
VKWKFRRWKHTRQLWARRWKNVTEANLYDLLISILFFNLGDWINGMWEADRKREQRDARLKSESDYLVEFFGNDV